MEHNYAVALFITVIAGLSTVGGGFLTFFVKRTNLNVLSTGLGFSAGVMLFIALYSILHESTDFLSGTFGEKSQMVTFMSFFVGVGIASLVDYFMPAHIANNLFPSSNQDVEEKQNIDPKMLKASILTTIAISIHRFPEGLATFLLASADLKLGIPFAIAIAIHNLPEGIAIALPVYHATGKKRLAILYSFIAGLAGAIGAVIGLILAHIFLPQYTVGMMFGAVAGIMVYISLDTLLPLAREYGDNHHMMVGIVTGMLFISISLLLF